MPSVQRDQAVEVGWKGEPWQRVPVVRVPLSVVAVAADVAEVEKVEVLDGQA